MKLDFNIGLAQKQGLSLTLQVQQAIKLLQMTNLEVNEYIEDNFLKTLSSNFRSIHHRLAL
jgi:RNA polymerase sigma-54 factor